MTSAHAAPVASPRAYLVLPDCLPDELVGLPVRHEGRRIGAVVDLALLDARHASCLLVRRARDGRVVRVAPEEVVAVDAEGVEVGRRP